jgi:DNA-binding transcriptional LysR family regulator
MEAVLAGNESAMNFQHVRAFHAVAKLGTTVAAARALGVSQPTLSQQIKALEDRHQLRLFERRGRKLLLTPAGIQLRDATSRLMAAVDDVELCLRQSEGTDTGGRLVLGADAPPHAAAMLAAFRRQHPSVQLTLVAGNASQTMENVLEGRVDAGIVANPPGEAGMIYQPIGFDPLHVLIPAGHPLTRGDCVPLTALAGETLLIREPRSRTRMLVEQLLDEASITPRELIEFGPREAIREGIALGMGVGVFISSECGGDSRLTSRLLAPGGPRFGLTEYVLCKQEWRARATVRAFLGVARDYAAQWAARQVSRG